MDSPNYIMSLTVPVVVKSIERVFRSHPADEHALQVAPSVLNWLAKQPGYEDEKQRLSAFVVPAVCELEAVYAGKKMSTRINTELSQESAAAVALLAWMGGDTPPEVKERIAAMVPNAMLAVENTYKGRELPPNMAVNLAVIDWFLSQNR
jgi:hypothetical protein